MENANIFSEHCLYVRIYGNCFRIITKTNFELFRILIVSVEMRRLIKYWSNASQDIIKFAQMPKHITLF